MFLHKLLAEKIQIWIIDQPGKENVLLSPATLSTLQETASRRERGMRKTKRRETERECVRVSELKGQERVGEKGERNKDETSWRKEFNEREKEREEDREREHFRDERIMELQARGKKEWQTHTDRACNCMIQQISRGTFTDFATVQWAAITSRGLENRGYFHCTEPCPLSSDHMLFCLSTLC